MTAQITVSTADGRSFSRPVDRDEFAVGRDSRNHLVLGDRQVSKFHCQLVKLDGGYAAKDLNSSNGTLINGIRVDGEVAISTGDRIRVGPYELVFAEGDEGLPGYLRPKGSSPVPEAFDPGAPSPADADVSDLLDPVSPAPEQGGNPPAGQFARSMPMTDPLAGRAPGASAADAARAAESGMTAREGHAYLEIVDGDGKGHMITVGSRGVTIGAGSRNNLVLDDPFVSRQHARVDLDGGRYVVKDTGSTNGIRVDGQDVAQAEMANGTRLQIGGVLMLFRRPGEGPPAPLAAQASVVPPLPPSGHPTQALTPGPPSRSGRTAATMREMSALPPNMQASATLGPATAPPNRAAPAPVAAATPAKRGVVALGGLQFRTWQLAILGAFGAVIVIALLFQAAGYMFNFGAGNTHRDMEPVYQAGVSSYETQDWDTAEGYLTQLIDIDPRHAEAQAYLQNIAQERDNLSRLGDVQEFVKLYTQSSAHLDFARAFEAYKSIPATSCYFLSAKALVEPMIPLVARRMVDEAVVALENDRVDDALDLLDGAEAYDPTVSGPDELRSIAEVKPRKRKKRIEEYKENLGRELDTAGIAETIEVEDSTAGQEKERDRDRDRERERERDRSSRDERRNSSSAEKVAEQAISAYTAGDVEQARSTLERAIDTASDPGQKLELQDVLGRVDRVERAFAAGNKAMDRGELDAALDRFESAYKNITRMDGSNTRRDEIRQGLAECRYRRGRGAFDNGKYAKANFEWSSGRKAWSSHKGVSAGRKELEEVAKGIYLEGYQTERGGSVESARESYEQVLAIAPRGDGFTYYDKAAARLAEL
jgi:pSer/pThr/pTyr-binding forkhead associated (FHA) protein/tetratricopeptide (TPR) repeat protein